MSAGLVFCFGGDPIREKSRGCKCRRMISWVNQAAEARAEPTWKHERRAPYATLSRITWHFLGFRTRPFRAADREPRDGSALPEW